MNSVTLHEHGILKDLGDGLVLRRSTAEDAEKLALFNQQIHGNPETGAPDLRVAVWTRDLLSGAHPTFRPDDFTIVEEAATGKIISSLNLIPQTWSYAGIPFKVGRPELVGTLPEYRHRGLVRHQFDVIHQWSARRGDLLQAITGIPYYYRLFGYEMALDLGGWRAGFRSHVPRLKEGQAEPYRVRPAGESDLPFILELYGQLCRRSLVACVWDEALLKYELAGKSPDNVNRVVLKVVETPEGERAAVLGHPPFTHGAMMSAIFYEVRPGLSWARVTPSVIRYLKAAHADYPGEHEQTEFEAFGFYLGASHPVYDLLLDDLPRVRKPYAWYLRVPDLPAFLRRIAPALEQRLADSMFTGHSGELKLSFYRAGLRLRFDQGRLAEAEPWTPAPDGHSGDAAFPGLTFLQLVFGYRSLAEIKSAFADCFTDRMEVHALLNALFPKQPSTVLPVS